MNGNLFARDTISLCEGISDTLKLSAPCPVNLIGAALSGSDISSFQIVSQTPIKFPSDSEIVIVCNPTRTGRLFAGLQLTSDDNRIWNFPLSMVVTPAPTVQLSAKNLSVAVSDTLGGRATVTCSIGNTGVNTNIDYTIHYDTSMLTYLGTFGSAHRDLTAGHTNGNSARISCNTSTDSLITTVFTFFPLDSTCATVTIDSLQLSGAQTQCLNLITNSLTTELCFSGCGIQTLAHFVRYGEVPHLTIVPNPSSGNVRIIADKKMTGVNIRVIDRYGIVHSIINNATVSSDGFEINTDDMPSGIYEVSVTNSTFRSSTRFVLLK
jgi:hypothetical protein